LPDAEAAGICRFYLQQVHPTFRLYVSALHIDPSNPGEQRITTPADFSQRIAQELDLFGTLGFQEDHKAFSNGVFTSDEFKTQADFVLEERLELLEFALRHYDDGLLFFYFSSTDLQSHMFWWETTQKHPTRSPDEVRHGYYLIVGIFERMDDRRAGGRPHRPAGHAAGHVRSRFLQLRPAVRPEYLAAGKRLPWPRHC
jgi:hypothetical protein